MKKSVSFASVLALLAVMVLQGVPVVHAQAQNQWTPSGWVSSGTISDLTGNSNLAANSALLAGHSYNLTLKITVPNTSTSTPHFQVSLNSNLLAAQGQSLFWAVHTGSYVGYDRTNFTAGNKIASFNYDQGTFSLSAYFSIPTNFTYPTGVFVTPSGNVTMKLHLPQNNVALVTVVPIGSTSAGAFSASVQDQTIQTYLTDYNQTANLVPTGKISQTYAPLVTSILGEAQALFNLGLPDQGTVLTLALTPSAFPVPPSSSLQTYLFVGLGAAVAVIVLLAVLTMRSRGKSGFSTGIVSEVQKDLAVLEVTAAKYDRTMADKLKSLRDKLGEVA